MAELFLHIALVDLERLRYRQRLADAERRLASYRACHSEAFSLAGELEDKRRQLTEIEKDLADDVITNAPGVDKAA
ncbi:hypothetical protein [Nitratireductor luteus]|uniref:hypothetical protein n=1 Tax=Nitratireductor luteus TaxID=2976980 RepID=UPI002240B031|nr:hypothetical protein [Nitratireductor luteus]